VLIFSIKPTPLTCCSIPRSQAFGPALPHFNNTLPTHIQAQPHVVRQNRAPVARNLIFSKKPTPLASRSIPWSQAFNPGLPHFNNTPPTHIRTPPHVVRQNRAPAARALIFSIKPTPSRVTRSRGPKPSTPTYPTSITPHLRIYKLHRTSFAKTEPWRLGL
jgi:hypothetical protein